MKLRVQKETTYLHKLITNYYDDYNIIHNTEIKENIYFMVVEKYFFRTANRASLSIVITQSDDGLFSIIEAVGSGGGQGMIFKFDWGAKESFESAIVNILKQEGIQYKEL